MVWITMSLVPHAVSKKRKKDDLKPHSQINKCLNEKRRREQENIHIEELAELLSASPSDMSSLSCKPDKCAILKETVNQIRSQKQSKSELCDDLQQSEVSSSKPNIINNTVFGSILLEALEGFLLVVNIDGKVEFVSENITSFLKYHQDEVIEKNIYDFIHADDQARFNSNLLLLMPVENNFNSAGKPTKHFNCRFLVRADEPEIKMENKQPSVPQYENLNLTANYIPLGNEGSDTRNGLTCIARRVVVEDKRVTVNNVEQFTTRSDKDGKVIDVDISLLHTVSGQYLKEELVDHNMVDFCHPSDVNTFKQHMVETFANGDSTCNPFKFRVLQDRYAKLKTKSKRFRSVQPAGEFMISTHSVIRDSESSTSLETSRSISSPSSVASTSSGPGSVSDSSTSVNGSVALSPLTMSNNSYGSYRTSTPPSNAEFALGDLVLDMFPSSSWSLDHSSSQIKDELTSGTSYASSPQAAPLSNRSSENSATASPTNSAFISGLASSRSGSSVPSPAMQSRTPTPFGGSCYSPSASQSSSGRSSPPRALPAIADSLTCSSTETLSINSVVNQGIRQERQFDLKSNQKLRNLLTQSNEDSSSRQVSRQASQDEVTVIGESRKYEEPPHLLAVNVREATNASRPKSNVILRDLLNQEDDDSDAPVEPIFRSEASSVPNPLLNAGACKGTESAQQRLGNNNMLRKLLNNDDGDRNYRKSQDIIHQLLIESSGNRASSFQNENRNIQNILNRRILPNSVPNTVSAESSRGSPDVTFIAESSAFKRKVVEKNPPNATVAKRQNIGVPHAYLAGQNPMLASMLAQTPSTPPTVPTSVASTMMTQLPQERLPKNLEKKLVHTPYTNASISGTATSTQAFSNILNAPLPIQSGILTTNSEGQLVRVQGLSNTRGSYVQQVTLEEENLLALGSRHLDLNFPTVSTTSAQNSQSFLQHLTRSSQSSTSLTNSDMIGDVAIVEADMSDSAQAADPVFAEILEQIYSLQEEHNLETCGAEDRAAILKLLGEVIESPPANIPPQQPVPSPTTTQDLNERIAINAIQKDLMEGAAIAISSRAANLQNSGSSATYSQAGRSGTQVSGTSSLHQSSLTVEQQLFLLQQQQQQLVNSAALPPNYNIIANRVRLPSTTQSQLISNPELLAQAQRRGLIVRNTYVNIGNANVNQIRKTMKQRLYLQQQQKRLLEQQQKQQLTMQTQQPLDVMNATGVNSFPENMSELLNSVAPNVTLLRSSDISEVPSSSRFNLTSPNPVPSPTSRTSPSPSQLSPGQRVNPRSPFSPLSQQSFPSQTPPPTSYQAAGLSPHPPPSYSQGGPSQSPIPMSPTTSHMVMSPQPSVAVSPQWNQRLTSSPIQNLQMQNPMLNAQLSQQNSVVQNQQVRLGAQQRQQLTLRSIPNQTAIQVSRNSTLTSQADISFSPLSPVMVLQSQVPHRIQRTISLTDRIAVSQSQPSLSSESVLSPQSLPSPTYVVASTPTSSVNSIPSSPSVPLTYGTAQSNHHFTFERQNAQAFASTSNEMSQRSPASVQSTSDLNRQEIRAILGGRNQVTLSTANQVLQSIPSSSTTTRVLNVQNLSRETLEELGLSGYLSVTDAQSSTQALYSQALLSMSNNMDSSPQPVSSQRVQVEEQRPADQKKSLLQQLLSEPT